MDFYRKIAGPIIILSNFVVAGIINIYLFISWYLVGQAHQRGLAHDSRRERTGSSTGTRS